MELAEIDLEPLRRAVATLAEGIAKSPKSRLERDGCIQRFEFTFELAWKTLRRVLIALGQSDVSGSPKPVLRSAFGEGLIDDLPAWFGFAKARNESSHIYDEETAASVYRAAEAFLVAAQRMVLRLEERARGEAKR